MANKSKKSWENVEKQLKIDLKYEIIIKNYQK